MRWVLLVLACCCAHVQAEEPKMGGDMERFDAGICELPVPARRSRVLRHADTVLCLGDVADRPGLKARLGMAFGDTVRYAKMREVPAELSTFDAVIILDLAEAEREQGLALIESLATGRQVVCSLEAFAHLFPMELVFAPDVSDGTAVVKENGYFMDGFAEGQVLPWHGKGGLIRGESFGWMAPRCGFKVVLEGYGGGIVAMEKAVPGGRLAAFDFSSLEGGNDDGFADLAFLLLGQALGREAVDMGIQAMPWKSHDRHLAEVEDWAERNADMVRIERLLPVSAEGRALRLVSIGDVASKPVILFSCCTHGHEWGPTYGVFAFLRSLMAEYRQGTLWARTVFDNLAIAWVPVVSVDGFQATWARGVCVPHGPRNVDLLYNYPPFEEWDTFQHWDGRPRGTAPFSEPEAQVMDSIYRRFAARGALYVDFHECTEDDFYIHDEPNGFVDGITSPLESVFKDRYVVREQGGALHQVAFCGNVISSGGPINRAYAKKLGFRQAFLAEFLGNNDYSSGHVIARTDAAATFAEQMVGAVLGRTVYNYRCGESAATLRFPELSTEEELAYVVVSADGKTVREEGTIKAGDGLSRMLGPGERIISSRARYRMEERIPNE
jgi:hypothetical protein